MVEIRTSALDDPHRNHTLSSREKQIECVCGAIAVEFPNSTDTTVRVTTVRGIPSRKGQFAHLNVAELDVLILLLTSAKTNLEQILKEKNDALPR